MQLIYLLILLSFISGFTASTCNFDVKIEQRLLNQGFHRKINYKVTFANKYGDSHLYDSCYVGIKQTLPSGVYAYPAELLDLWRMKQLTASTKDRVNVELAAEQAQPISVFIYAQLENRTADLWLPVHARYHNAASAGGFIVNKIDSPHLLLRCSNLDQIYECKPKTPLFKFPCRGIGDEMCFWKKIPISVVTKPVKLIVPIGNLDHSYIVNITSIVSLIICSLYLLKTVHDKKLAEARKALEKTQKKTQAKAPEKTQEKIQEKTQKKTQKNNQEKTQENKQEKTEEK